MRGACFLLIALAGVSGGLAQDEGSDNAIHAITTLHEDGTKTVTITDPDKRTSEASTYDARDKLIQKIIYALDDNNRPATGVVYAKDNSPVLKTVYKHDDMNRLSEEDDYTMDDQLLRRFVYDFDSSGDITQIHTFDSQGNEVMPTDARKDPHTVPPRRH